MSTTETRPAVDDRPRFEGAWETRLLDEIADCLDGLRVPLNEAQRSNMQGSYPYCGANGILDHINDYVLDDDVILMAEDGGHFDEYLTRPIAYRMSGPIWVNNHAHILRAKSTFEQSFLFYSLVHKDIRSFLASGTRAKLNKGEMVKIEVFAPKSLPEQRAIAAALSDVDDLLQSLDRLIAKKRDVKQGAMQQLLTGTTRLPGFEGEWETKRLGEIGRCLRGVGYDPDRDLAPHDTDFTYRLLRSTNVQGGRLDLASLQFVDQSRVARVQQLRENDLVFCAANGSRALVGKSARFDVRDGHRYTFGAFMGAFRASPEDASSEFAGHLFQSDAFFRCVDLVLSGSAINNLSPSEVEAFSFEVPPLTEQRAIAAVLSDMDAEIDALEARRDKAAAIKQGMMQELLTGRTRLPIPQEVES